MGSLQHAYCTHGKGCGPHLEPALQGHLQELRPQGCHPAGGGDRARPAPGTLAEPRGRYVTKRQSSAPASGGKSLQPPRRWAQEQQGLDPSQASRAHAMPSSHHRASAGGSPRGGKGDSLRWVMALGSGSPSHSRDAASAWGRTAGAAGTGQGQRYCAPAWPAFVR